MNLPPLLEGALDRAARCLVARARTQAPGHRPGVRRPVLEVAHNEAELLAVVALQHLAEGVVLAVAPGPARVGRYLSPLPSVSALVERLLDAVVGFGLAGL
jgi:hypothetical protein